jgi:PAS domain S-box-containing protein
MYPHGDPDPATPGAEAAGEPVRLGPRLAADEVRVLRAAAMADPLVAQFLELFAGAAEFGQALEVALAALGNELSVDRAYVAHLDTDAGVSSGMVEWVADGTHRQLDMWRELSMALLPWSTEVLLSGDGIVINELRDFVEGADSGRGLAGARGIKSLVNLPLRHAHETVGTLVVEVEHKERQWTPQEVGLLAAVASLMAVAWRERTGADAGADAGATAMLRQDGVPAEPSQADKRLADLLETQRAHIKTLQACTQGVAILRDDRFIFMNEAHAVMYGWKAPANLMGQHWRTLYAPEQIAEIEGLWFPQLVRDGTCAGRTYGLRADGSHFPVEVSLTLLDEGLYSCVCTDLSMQSHQQRVLVSVSDRLSVALQAIRAGAWSWNGRSGRIEYETMAQMLPEIGDSGLLSVESLLEHIPEADRRLLRAVQGRILRTRRMDFRTSFRFRRSNGSMVRLILTGKATPPGPEGHWSAEGIVQDAAVLDDTTPEREDVLSLVRHDLNTPLTTIRGFAELIQMATPDDDKRRRHATMIMTEVERLKQAIQRFAQLQHVPRNLGADQFVRTPVALVLATLETRCASMPHWQRVRTQTDENLPDVYTDADGLASILYELIRNATAASDYDEPVSLRVRLHNEEVVFQVVDQGVGIPAEEQALVFQRYYRTRYARDHHLPGTGLGLALVEATAQRLGISITLQSRQPAGTTVTVSVPTAELACEDGHGQR